MTADTVPNIWQPSGHVPSAQSVTYDVFDYAAGASTLGDVQSIPTCRGLVAVISQAGAGRRLRWQPADAPRW